MTDAPTTLPMTREVTLTRIIEAPRALVWAAWTEPRHMAQWWGPHHFTNPRCELDVRPGGVIHIDMRAPDGTMYPMGGIYHEIAPHERIVLTSFVDMADGTRLVESHNTVLFTEHGGKTKVILRARAAGFTQLASRFTR